MLAVRDVNPNSRTLCPKHYLGPELSVYMSRLGPELSVYMSQCRNCTFIPLYICIPQGAVIALRDGACTKIVTGTENYYEIGVYYEHQSICEVTVVERKTQGAVLRIRDVNPI